MRFSARIQLNGKTATGIQVPDEIVASLGSNKRPPVFVTIHGYTYRSTVATMGGAFMLPVSADVRERAGIAAGDEVEVEVELDAEPRDVALPADLVAALDGNAGARGFFDELSYSNKRRLVLQIEETKAPETRQRRIATTITKLEEHRI